MLGYSCECFDWSVACERGGASVPYGFVTKVAARFESVRRTGIDYCFVFCFEKFKASE